MNRLIEIDKKAIIARINQARKRTVVDTRFCEVQGQTKMIMVFNDGSEEIFRGLNRAA